MYKLKISRREKKKLLRARWVIVFVALLGISLIVWLAWIRPVQKGSNVHSFEECSVAGYPIQESYPEVCVTPDGKRFVNLEQQAAHQAALDGEQELVPPTNPALLKLDIEEWGVTIPLTLNTFDLTYAYVESGNEDYVLFTYKRLIRLDVCKGDIGLKITRLFTQNQPPFSDSRPAPVASADKAYFYAHRQGKSCYDSKDPEQAALVKELAGDKELRDATLDLISKIEVTPKTQ